MNRAGFDSTIYDPKPDLVFKNDTAHYVLVQTRLAVPTYSSTFTVLLMVARLMLVSRWFSNLVQPGDPIITETTDLAPGVKKQTDTAHVGADAYFTRKITLRGWDHKG